MTNRAWTRRSFLSSIGLGAAAYGALPCLEAEAQDPIPKRLVLFITGNGTVPQHFVPSGGRPSRILMPLERHWDRVSVIAGGLEQRVFRSGGAGRDHVRSHPQLLTGRRIAEDRATAAAGISIDHHIARTIGAGRPFSTLHLGAGEAGAYSFTGANAPFNAERDPSRALGRVFAGVGESAPTEVGPSRRDRQRLRIADFAQTQLADVRRRVGRADTLRVDAHVEALDTLERRIEALTMLGETCGRPDVGAGTGYERAPDLHAEIVAGALACDLTRVAVVTLGNSGNVGLVFSWLGISQDTHELVHAARASRPGRGEPEAVELNTRQEEWNAERFARLLDAIGSRTAADGSSLLDHTVVAWVSPLGAGDHDVMNMPFVIGSGGGLLRQGRVLALSDKTTNDFHLTLARAFGLEDATFGEAEFNTGVISELLV